MFHVYSSNQLESLVETLAQIVADPLPDPLMPEQIMVQSKGMERWLAIQLAERLGIWANAEFPFPNTIIWRLFRQLFGQLPEKSKFEREVMLWQFMRMLPECLAEKNFTELRHYLTDDTKGVKLFQLSLRIADIFDQYTLYRPQMLIDWEKNPEQAGWQSALWQRLITHYDNNQHRGQLWTRFMSADLSPLVNTLPPRLSVFGVPNLPPAYLHILSRLGEIIDIHLFLFNPSQEHWGYIVSDSDMARLARKKQGQLVSPEAQYYEKGNSLLASMGRMAKEFFELVEERSHQTHDLFHDPGTDTLLHTLQSDILNLRERTRTMPGSQREKVEYSLQIQQCHSPMREVEVLHDQLLALFEANPTLLPRDVVVMMPAIEDYAPFIEAVFAIEREAVPALPFSIADRALRSESTLIDTFIAILELERGRFIATDVLSILETDAVQRRFALSLTDLALIKTWVQKTTIRWGMDAESRAALTLPPFAEHTWRAGLDRLLLGFALPGQGQHLFADILPFDDIEGQETLVLGKLTAFVEALFSVMQEFTQAHLPSKWEILLSNVLEQFFQPNEIEEAEAQAVRSVLRQLADSSAQGEFNQPISLATVLAYLRNYVESVSPPLHFLTGNITFCTLLPMRSIPFRVVCLLGMNDHSYPRSQRPLNFDLIAQKPEKGDRSLRHNDRYLFLEALLSARDYFYLSYVGYNIQDNSDRPPSVLVSELIDYLDNGFCTATGDSLLPSLICPHPLQPFSPRYFSQEAAHLFSYSQEYRRASEVLKKERITLWQTFLTEPLPPPEASWRTVELEQLVQFFSNPTQFLLRERLEILLNTEEDLLEESEPFNLESLSAYQFQQNLVETALADHDLTAYFHRARASGQLPHGVIGDVVYQRIAEEVKPFVVDVKAATNTERLLPQAVDLILGDFRLLGRLDKLWTTQQVFYRYTKLKGKDFVRLWLYHLVLNSQAEPHLPKRSILIGKGDSISLQSVQNSQALLAKLLALYWQGCSTLLPFFAQPGLAYMETLMGSKGNPDKALQKAQNTWCINNEFCKTGEYYQSPYYQLAYQHDTESPINEEFVQLVKHFFGELWAARATE